MFGLYMVRRDNGNVHRAAAKDLQAEKPARPAAPCATYCYTASSHLSSNSGKSRMSTIQSVNMYGITA